MSEIDWYRIAGQAWAKVDAQYLGDEGPEPLAAEAAALGPGLRAAVDAVLAAARPGDWRAGYDAAVEEMRGVVARTGSPAANWAALYLASQREYVERRVADSNCVRCGQGVTSAVHLLDCLPDSSGEVEDAPERTDVRIVIADEFARFLHEEGARHRPYDFADGLLRFLGESGWSVQPALSAQLPEERSDEGQKKPAVDLMAALRASVDRARASRAAGARDPRSVSGLPVDGQDQP